MQNLTFRYIRDGSLTRTGPRYLNATSSTSPVRYEVADFFALEDSFDLAELLGPGAGASKPAGAAGAPFAISCRCAGIP